MPYLCLTNYSILATPLHLTLICSMQFVVLYLGKIPIISMYVILFPGKNFLYLIESFCLWLDHSDSAGLHMLLCIRIISVNKCEQLHDCYTTLYVRVYLMRHYRSLILR